MSPTPANATLDDGDIGVAFDRSNRAVEIVLYHPQLNSQTITLVLDRDRAFQLLDLLRAACAEFLR